MSNTAMKQAGAFSWNELLTTDVQGAKAFYGELLGWRLEDVKPSGMDYTLVKLGEKEVGGHHGHSGPSGGDGAGLGKLCHRE